MSLRRKRMQKVLELRERTLQERAGALTQAHQGRVAAQEQAESAASHLREAAAYRQQLTSGSVKVEAWIDAEQWLVQRSRQHNLAQMRLQGAETLVVQAYEEVIEARSGVKRIERLDQRLATLEMRQQERLEQKVSDEHSQRRFATSRRWDSD